jgi:hypothetical protein
LEKAANQDQAKRSMYGQLQENSESDRAHRFTVSGIAGQWAFR